MELSDYFTIEELRKHCRIDFDDDDQDLELYALAAIEAVSAVINRPILKKGEKETEFNADAEEWPVSFNYRIRSAALLMVSDLYENRGANIDYQTYENRAFNILLEPLRNIQIRFSE